MNVIDIRGVIVPDDDLWIYEWFEMTATSPKAVRDALDKAGGGHVVVTINSGGGDVRAGQEIYTLLREYPGSVQISIQSMAASAAAIIAMARVSEMSPVAQLMIHNVSSSARGDYRDMEHAAQVLRNSNQALAAALVEKTGKTEAEVLALMDRETWYTAQQAVEAGFVDRIAETNRQSTGGAMQLAASFGPGLLPAHAIEYAKAHFKNNAAAKAEAEYEFLLMEVKTK